MLDLNINCPFCGSGNLKIMDKSFFSINSYSVYCRDCLCHGPNGVNIDEAIEKWEECKTFEFKFVHKDSKEEKTVSISFDKIKELIEDYDICECDCQPIGETNVIEK